MLIFKLADRMRSMRTNGASKNRDYCDTNGPLFPLFSIWIIFGTYGMFQCVRMNTYGMYVYLWYVYLCIRIFSTNFFEEFFFNKFF